MAIVPSPEVAEDFNGAVNETVGAVILLSGPSSRLHHTSTDESNAWSDNRISQGSTLIP